MILQPIDFIVYAWLTIAVLSSTYVAYDQFRNNPEVPVMKWGFVLSPSRRILTGMNIFTRGGTLR